MRKLMTSNDLVKIVKDGCTVTGTGFSFMTPEELFIALEESFLETGHPRDLTILVPGGAGNLRGKGFDHFAHDGFIKKVIAPYYNLTPALANMVLEERVEAYMLPAGALAQLLRDIGAKRPGLITHVGLGTFADPRVEGGALNSRSKERLTEIIEIDGKEYIRYKPIHIDVALIKVTTADGFGNCTMEKEAGFLTTLPMAIATHNCGGKVIVQAERVASIDTLKPQRVLVPGILVDGIVIARPENHWMTWREQYNPARSGEVRVAALDLPPVEMGPEKVVARRAIYQLEPGEVVNLGAGMPEYISSVTWEEKIFDKIILTVEAGMIGGVPGFGLQFNTASNPYAIIDQSFQMDLYDGGGNDASCVGFAQIDEQGNVNVSKLNSRIPGVGGFLNVFPRSKKRVHCGGFTAGKSKIEIRDGKLNIIEDGNVIKFVKKVNQITLNGSYINNFTVPTVIITERAVFHYSKDDGMVLVEIAPGVDLKKDILDKMEFQPVISKDLKQMPSELFDERMLNLCGREPWKDYTLQG
ncbi:MAG: Acetate CoA-transferase YdiF [Pelotomaculum sp. PtaU1.Bin035]|nr:MAG: Acetate CoA-transferase YdiF [Pelotomaculum sp. PtaU1.Bin035]